MPENANRLAHLHQHLAQSTQVPYDLARARLVHRGQPLCAAGCGWPLDPALTGEGWRTHPACTPDPDPDAGRPQ